VPELFTVVMAALEFSVAAVPSFVRFDRELSTETMLSQCSKTPETQGR
jgi:hypothetical protein